MHINFKFKLSVAANTVDQTICFVTKPMWIAYPLVTIGFSLSNAVFELTGKVRIPVLCKEFVKSLEFLEMMDPSVAYGLEDFPMIGRDVVKESQTLSKGQPVV